MQPGMPSRSCGGSRKFNPKKIHCLEQLHVQALDFWPWSGRKGGEARPSAKPHGKCYYIWWKGPWIVFHKTML